MGRRNVSISRKGRMNDSVYPHGEFADLRDRFGKPRLSARGYIPPRSKRAMVGGTDGNLAMLAMSNLRLTEKTRRPKVRVSPSPPFHRVRC